MWEILNAIFYVLVEGVRWRSLIFRPGKRYTPTFAPGAKTKLGCNCMTVCVDKNRAGASSESIGSNRRQSKYQECGDGESIGGLRCGQTHQGRKRFLTVDSLGLVEFWSPQRVLENEGWQTSAQTSQKMGKSVSRLHTIWVDAGFDGEPFMQWVMDVWIVQVVLRPQQTKGFVLLKNGGW